MQPVDVLARVDQVEHRLFVQPLRQGQLHEDAVHCRIGVELAHQLHELVLRRVGRQGVGHTFDSHLLGRLALVANVDLGGRIFANEHDVQGRSTSISVDEGRNSLLDLSLDLLGNSLAVENLGLVSHGPCP